MRAGVSLLPRKGLSCAGASNVIGAKEILAVNSCRYVGEDGLYIAFDGVLPLLVRCGALVSTLVFLVELVGFV